MQLTPDCQELGLQMVEANVGRHASTAGKLRVVFAAEDDDGAPSCMVKHHDGSVQGGRKLLVRVSLLRQCCSHVSDVILLLLLSSTNRHTSVRAVQSSKDLADCANSPIADSLYANAIL